MKNILTRLLNKRGIENSTELSQEERVQFDTWNRILSKESVTLQDFSQFCDVQIGAIDRALEDVDRTSERTDRLVVQRVVYAKIKSFLTSPQAEREQLEKYLEQLINT
jgi:hypothetical protein